MSAGSLRLETSPMGFSFPTAPACHIRLIYYLASPSRNRTHRPADPGRPVVTTEQVDSLDRMMTLTFGNRLFL